MNFGRSWSTPVTDQSAVDRWKAAKARKSQHRHILAGASLVAFFGVLALAGYLAKNPVVSGDGLIVLLVDAVGWVAAIIVVCVTMLLMVFFAAVFIFYCLMPFFVFGIWRTLRRVERQCAGPVPPPIRKENQ